MGAGILLFVIGAIMRFALTMELSWVDLPLVGNISMAVSVVIFLSRMISLSVYTAPPHRTPVGAISTENLTRRAAR